MDEFSIPILENHNQKSVIGKISTKGNKLILKFNEGKSMTDDMLFRMFNCGMVIIESEIIDNVRFIKSCEIVEFTHNTVVEPKKA